MKLNKIRMSIHDREKPTTRKYHKAHGVLRRSFTERSAIILLIAGCYTAAALAVEEAESDWGFDLVLGWAWKDIDGTMFSANPPLSGAGTADSLGLGSSSEPQAAFGVRWKQLHVDLVYLPSEFEGNGHIAQVLDFGNGPVLGTTTAVSSDLKVTMALANVEYDLLKRKDMDWGVGVGIGKVGLDIKMQPQTGPRVDIEGDVPFGYLTTSFAKRWQKFSVDFTVQGLSFSQGDVSMSYKSVSIAGGYKLFAKDQLRFDLVGGYHYVDFDYEFDDDSTGVKTSTDFTLTGPYVGVRMGW